MRIIQTINDTIRLLFNPKTEVFCLSDFLLVRDVEENFLAQVVEVYDDKFDQEANVAKIKLIYRIVNGNELVPYDNYTPSRECEVAKIKQSDIEKCINLNKKTIIAGKNAHTGVPVEINTRFFENHCVIFADKFEQTNKITECLAPRLSKYKNVLVLDFSGTCDLESASRFVSGKNFKMPLSADTIDYIQQKTLLRAKLETQVVLGEIFEEVKNYLMSSQDGYIPFSRFIQVIEAECKKSPSVELLVLISWLRKYKRQGLFAKAKQEFEPLFASLLQNRLTILDVSNIKTEWQKEFVEFVINNIQNDVFVMVRLNDNNINNDILNTIYLKKKNVSFIPSFAYGYKKASYIMEFAQNYILLPTLNPKRDFNHANFQIQALNNESFILFGDDTKDFIFVLELKSPIKKFKKVNAGETDDENTDKLFVSLNLQLDDMTPLELRPTNFELKKIETNRRRMQEEIRLSDVLKVNKDDKKPVYVDEEELTDDEIEKMQPAPEFDDTALVSMADENILGEDELDYFEQSAENQPDEVLEPTADTSLESENIVENQENEQDTEVDADESEAELGDELDGELANEEAAEIEAEIIKQTEREVLENEQAEGEVETETPDDTADEGDLAPDMPKIKTQVKEEPKEDEPQEADETSLIASDGRKNELLELAKENEEPGDEPENEGDDTDKETNTEEKAALEAEEADETPIEQQVEIDDNILDAIDEVNGVSVETVEEEEIEKTTVEELVAEKIKLAKEKLELNKKETEEEFEAKEKPAEAEPDEGTIDAEKAVDEEAIIEAESVAETPSKKAEAAAKEIEAEAHEPHEGKEKADEVEKPAKGTDLAEENIEAVTPDKQDEKKPEIAAESILEKTAEPEKNEEEIATDKRFDEILSEENEEETRKEMLKIDEKNSIDLEKIKEEIKKPEHKLPVFDDENEDASGVSVGNFNEGDSVSHDSYGVGQILKVIKYSNRCLLQIEFPEIGKRLLDPKIAKLSIVKED